MTKTQEELKELKQEYETLSIKLKELTEDELNIVTGGLSDIPGLEAITPWICVGKSVNVNEVLTNTVKGWIDDADPKD